MQNLYFSAIATSEVEDVRTVLEYYSQFDDPIQVFKENQRKLQVIFEIMLSLLYVQFVKHGS